MATKKATTKTEELIRQKARELAEIVYSTSAPEEQLGDALMEVMLEKVQDAYSYDRTTYFGSVLSEALEEVIPSQVERLIEQNSKLIKEKVEAAFRDQLDEVVERIVDQVIERVGL